MGDINGPFGGTTSKDRSELYMAEDADEHENENETSRLLELANSIQAQVAQIQKYLTETKQANPWFEASSPLVDWERRPDVDDLRSACLENLTQLQDLLMTPRELLHSQTVSHNCYKTQKVEYHTNINPAN